MGLKSMSITTGATISVTGGTALSLTDDGQAIANGIHLICVTDTDFASRRQATVKYRPAAYDVKTNSYNKDKKTISFVQPVDVNGKIFFNTLRVEREVHPTTDSSVLADMNKLGAQLLIDADSEGFWANGSLS